MGTGVFRFVIFLTTDQLLLIYILDRYDYCFVEDNI